LIGAPIITVTGKAYWDVGHAPKDQSNRRSHLPGYAAWEIHPVMKLNVQILIGRILCLNRLKIQMIAHLANFCRWASIALSFASACFWFAASITKATNPDDRIGIESHYKDKKGREIYINATAKKQNVFAVEPGSCSPVRIS
jgi:hypothetical protein